MNRITTRLLASTLVLGAFGSAFAADGPKTRADVRAEYERAVRSGDILDVNTGYLVKDLRATPAASTVSREQVRAEHARAVRAGDVYEVNTLRRENELNPQRYAVQPAPVRSREEVRGELQDAIRAGNLPVFLGG